MKEILDVILDALLDSAIIFPFLLAVYILMELIENANKKESIEKALSGTFAPLPATALGIVPECGFSVMCAKLFDKGLIGFGTLISAFIATSDEGLIILISNAEIKYSLFLILFKGVFAIVIGIAFNLLFKGMQNSHTCSPKDDCAECGEKHEKGIDKYLLHPLKHALKTFIYILIVNLIIGFLFYIIGENNIISFIENSKGYQPIITSLFGIIPNCASSVILAEGFSSGVITFAGLLAGLTTNSGVGALILFKNKKNIKKNIIIVLTLYLCGLALGYLSMPIIK